MTEEELKNIGAPDKKAMTPKKQKINTYIFVGISSILNLVITIVLVFAFLLLSVFIFRSMTPDMSAESFGKVLTPIRIVAVVAGIWVSFIIQKCLTKAVIKGFKMQDKLQPDFVARYLMEKK